MEQEKKAEEVNALKGDKKEITLGSQIRSYIFTPYTMVKDHRTGYEVPRLIQVMDEILKASSMPTSSGAWKNSNNILIFKY